MIRSRNKENNIPEDNTSSVKARRKFRRAKRSDFDFLLEQYLLPAISFSIFLTVTIYYLLSSSSYVPKRNVAAAYSENESIHSSDEVKHSKTQHYGPRFDEMPGVGDKSPAYRKLREEYDTKMLPIDATETREKLVESLHKNIYKPMEDTDMGYDIYNCPLHPPNNYPFEFNLVSEVLSHWPPDDTTPRKNIHQSLCVFNFETELEKALNYREEEVPFIVRGDPEVHRTVERWADPQYLSRLLGNEVHRAEYSANNHFMYWAAPNRSRGKKVEGGVRVGKKFIPDDWEEPTKLIRMTYNDWLSKANVDASKLGPDNPHWYFRLIGCGQMDERACDANNSEMLFDELPFFQPKPNLYIVDPRKQKGIHCRFGMKGVIAENHFDGSRNTIALLGGERRYILAHPHQCENLALLPNHHPSGRHSAVDWSDPDLEEYPQFRNAMGNEVVMQAGDLLYLPTNWFHYIISLDVNFQCNTRSGRTDDYPLAFCGF